MGKDTSYTSSLSMPTWETLEGWLREEIEVRIQSIVGQGVTEFLGRGWYERKRAVDAAPSERDGFGKLLGLSTSLWHDKGQAAPCSWFERAFRVAGSRPCSRVAQKKWEHSSQSSICTVWPRATSNWPSGGCSEMGRRFLHRRLRVFAASLRSITRVIGAMSDGRKGVSALVPVYRASTLSWLEVLTRPTGPRLAISHPEGR